MKANFFRWENPILNDDVKTVFEENYGKNAQSILDVLETSPDEIAVISMLLTYLDSLGSSRKD